MITSKVRKSNIVKLLSVFLICTLILGLMITGVFAASSGTKVTAQLSPQIEIVLDGEQQIFYNVQGQEVHPISYNGSTYLPLRAIGELMGKNVNWDQSTLTVTLDGTRTAAKTSGTPDTNAKKQSVTVQIRPDFTIVVDGTVRNFTDANGDTVYPMLYNGSTYLPVRAISGLMGCSVNWNSATSTVILTSAGDSLVTDADSFNQGNGGANGTNNQTGQTSGSVISVETAKSKALAHAGLTASKVTFIENKLEWDDGRQVYDIEFYTSDYKEYDYTIDAVSGNVLEFDYDAENSIPAQSSSFDNTSYIGESRAKEISLERAGVSASQATFQKVKLDYDDGRWEYEVEFRSGDYEYELTIDDVSGTILDYERDFCWD